MSKKLGYFIPPKPVVEPFGVSSGTAHQFWLGRDGVQEIELDDVGSVYITVERPGGKRAQFVQPAGGGYGQVLPEPAPRK